MAEGRIGYVIDIQTNAKQAMRDMNDFRKEIDSMARDAARGSGIAGKSISDMAADIESAYAALDDARFKNEQMLKRTMEMIRFSTGEDTAALAQLRDVLESNALEIKHTADELTRYEQEQAKSDAATKQMETSHVSARTRMREMREELIRMREAGLENTQAYRDLANQLGKLTDIQGDVNSEARKLASDQGVLQGIIGGINGVAAAFSVAQGAIGLFGDKNNELERIMLRVQSVMAITVGLSQIESTLNKDNAFRQNIVNRLKAAYAANLAKQAAAQAAANAGMTVEIGLLGKMRAVLSTVPLLGWITAVGTAGAAIAAWIKKTRDARRANEELAGSADKVTRAYTDMREEMDRRVSRDSMLSSEWYKDLGTQLDGLRGKLNVLKNLGVEKNIHKDVEQYIGELMYEAGRKADATGKAIDKAEYERLSALNVYARMVASKNEGDIEQAKKDLERYYKEYKSAMRTVAKTEPHKTKPRTTEVKEESQQGTMQTAMDEQYKEAMELAKVYDEYLRGLYDANMDYNAKIKAENEQYVRDMHTLSNDLTHDEATRNAAIEQLRKNHIERLERLSDEEASAIEKSVQEMYKKRVIAAEAIGGDEGKKALADIEREILTSLAAAYEKAGFADKAEETRNELKKLEEDTGRTTVSIRESIQKNIADVGQVFSAAGKMVNEFTDALAECGKVSDANAQKVKNAGEAVSSIIGGAAQGAAAGGILGNPVIGAVIGGTISGITELLKSIGRGAKKVKELQEELEKLREEVAKLRDETRGVAVFGSDTQLDGIMKAMDELRDAQEEYLQFLSFLAELSEDMLVPYTRLLEVSEAQIEEYQKRMTSSLKSVGDSISSMFNQIGRGIVSMLSDSSRTTEDLIAGMKDDIAGYVREWVAQVVYVKKIQKQLAAEEEIIMEAAESGDMSYLSKVLSESLKRIYGYIPEWAALRDTVNKIEEEAGFGAASSSRQSAMSGAVSGMSAETASLLAGQLTAMRMNAANIDSAMTQTLYHVSGIHNNTDRIASDISDIKAGIKYTQRTNGI